MSHKCLDISAWQEKPNFLKIKQDGYDYIILKCGGSDGGFYVDSRFHYNYQTAKQRGFKIGAYYFAGSDFTSKKMGKDCANECLSIIKEYTFDLPIYIDVEATSPNDYYGTTQAILAFCDVLEKGGFATGVYSYATGFNSLFSYDSVKNKSLWVADWSEKRSEFPPKCDIWQYTSTGKVNGINGFVDLDICYIDKSAVSVAKKMNKTNVNNVYNSYKVKYKNIAIAVIQGKYGNGEERKKKIIKQGYDYNFVQALVNAMLSEKT